MPAVECSRHSRSDWITIALRLTAWSGPLDLPFFSLVRLCSQSPWKTNERKACLLFSNINCSVLKMKYLRIRSKKTNLLTGWNYWFQPVTDTHPPCWQTNSERSPFSCPTTGSNTTLDRSWPTDSAAGVETHCALLEPVRVGGLISISVWRKSSAIGQK